MTDSELRLLTFQTFTSAVTSESHSPAATALQSLHATFGSGLLLCLQSGTGHDRPRDRSRYELMELFSYLSL